VHAILLEVSMTKAPPDLEQLEIKTIDELWSWLELRHASSSSVLLVTFKKSVPHRYVSRDDVLDALVAFGWTDGRRWTVDADRTMQLISPRRTEVWARSYKNRAMKLIAEGRMRPAGLASLNAAMQSRRWRESDPVDDLQVPADLQLKLRELSGAWDYFSHCPPSYRRNVLRWISQARTSPTRAKRLEECVVACAREVRLKHF
jgi:uncharacterized protein YdeI (YjbR/CyaY-like superfamily)